MASLGRGGKRITSSAGATLAALSGDVISTIAGVATVLAISGPSPVNINTASTVRWASAVAAPTLTQATVAGAGAANGQTLTIQAQNGQNQTGINANTNGGNLLMASGAPGSGGSGGSGTPGTVTLQATGFAGEGSTSAQLQVISAVAGAAANGVALISAPNFIWGSLQDSPLITQSTQSVGANPNSMTIAPQGPNAGASGASNGTPGSLLLNLAAPVSTGGEAQFQVQRAGTKVCSIGAQPGTPTNSCVWLSNVTPGANNWNLAANSSQLFIGAAGGTGILVASNNVTVCGGVQSYGGGSGVLLHVNAAVVPTSNPTNGLLAFSSGGNFVIRGSGGLQLSTQQVSKAANYTIDSGTTPDGTIWMNSSGGAWTLTLPTPTAGREFILVDAGNALATHNVTLARHAAENINGAGANLALATSGASYMVTSDGTNWWTSKSVVGG
jgi:hypothetical protein